MICLKCHHQLREGAKFCDSCGMDITTNSHLERQSSVEPHEKFEDSRDGFEESVITGAEPGVRGTTIMNQQFWNEAKSAALKAKFNVSSSAPAFQQGTISYKFVLD